MRPCCPQAPQAGSRVARLPQGAAATEACFVALRRSCSVRILAFVVLCALAGCSDAQKRAWKPLPANQCYKTALEAENGDTRRDAVCRIAESKYVTHQDAFNVLDTVARTDPLDQVRCIAVKAFTRYNDSRPVDALVAILRAKAGSKEALPAGDDVRWESASALLGFEERGLIPETQRTAIRPIFIALAGDSSRNVRIVATEALAHYQHRDVLRPLFENLRNEDFAIADAAERSLIALTGETHDYDANAWEAWAASSPDPFAHAGRKVVTTRPAGPTWFDKQIRAWRRGLKLGNVD